MRKITGLILIFQFFFIYLAAQNTAAPPADKSPMDMSYFPVNYPVLKIQDKANEPLAARVVYSRPQRAGRTVFGGLVKYGELWRMGANEATEIEFYKSVKIGGKKVSKGRYTLYAIVNENDWTIIINKETDTWGAFKYDPKKDLVRATASVKKNETPLEYLSIYFERSTAGYNLIIAWDTVKASLPVTY
jgi:Protein of unknown function (DUF2911)